MTTATTTATTTARTARAPRSIRVVPALLLAVAVLLVAVAGSATAAKMITGKQIKNGSITSLDVRNSNLTGADLKNGTVSGADVKDGTLSGADVKDGSVAMSDLADHSVGRDQVAIEDRITAGLIGYAPIDVTNCPDQTLQICPALAAVQETGTMAITMTGTLVSLGDSVPTPTRCGLYYKGLVRSDVSFAPGADGQPGSMLPFTLQASVFVEDPAVLPQLRCTQFAGDDLRVTGLKTNVVQVHFID